MTVRIIIGDARGRLAELSDGSVHCCVTSPPYFGLRDYGMPGQIGLEPTPERFVSELVEVFREVRRVLRDDGTLWLNLGDSYAGSWGARGRGAGTNSARPDLEEKHGTAAPNRHGFASLGIKPKDLIGIPWRVAFALQADGWWLRGDHIWGKPNGMPESVEDRPARGHEYVFLLTKSERYHYDFRAVRSAPKADSVMRLARSIRTDGDETQLAGGVYSPPGQPANSKARRSDKQRGHTRRHAGFNDRWDAMERAEQISEGSNLRSIWWVSPAQYPEAHFAVMPDMVAEICIAAGCPKGGTVLDPFFGAGTTGLVADQLGRDCIGIELNPEYAEMAQQRIAADAGMFAKVAAE